MKSHRLALLLCALLPGSVWGDDAYQKTIRPLLAKYCLTCHSTEKQKGELDLERFQTVTDIRRDAKVWQQVLHQFDIDEMPPAKSPQPTKEEFIALQKWIRSTLDAEALARAGDPGPVVLRRLNNAEYTYAIQDLTGVALDPAREFPVDGAAGEGFLNTGASLSMSPSMVDKQLAAAKEIARHMVMTPTGIRFSESELRGDWVEEIVRQIRAIYLRHTGGRDTGFNYTGDVAVPTPKDAREGRLEVAPYLHALIRHRTAIAKDPDAAGPIAEAAGLNARYAIRLARLLSPDGPRTPLFEQLRERWNGVANQDPGLLAGEVGRWQNHLWQFNRIGNFGRIKKWQAPKSPLKRAREITIELNRRPNPEGEPLIHLFAGTARDGDTGDLALWQQPRIVHSGRPPILLRDVRGGMIGLQKKSKEVLRQTEQYLAAAYDLRSNANETVEQVAARHQVDPEFLEAWLDNLGIAAKGRLRLSGYLHEKRERVGGYAQVKGWGMPGQPALSVVGNSSDQALRIAADSQPGQIGCHPMPDRWVAVGWQSPLAGDVKIITKVRHAHDACGNGIGWRLEHRRGRHISVLARGEVELSGTAEIAPIEKHAIHKGDLISIVIFAKNRNHGCDFTEIDLEIRPLENTDRHWVLSKDCAPNMLAGNPHPDRYGTSDIWHFYSGKDMGDPTQFHFPTGSLVDRWLKENDRQEAAELAKSISDLLAPSPPTTLHEADAMIRTNLTSLNGPLFSLVDPGKFARLATPEELSESEYGLDPNLFDEKGNLSMKAPQTHHFKVPAIWSEDANFVTRGELAPNAGSEASMQLEAAFWLPGATDHLHAHLPILVRKGTAGERRLENELNAFRENFPAALAFTQIVPTDEVVTLLMFYRGDEHVINLMATETERRELDRLWDELKFVSREPLRLVTIYEQLWQFATQTGSPKPYEPMEPGIRADAAQFAKRLVNAEPMHLNALLSFANRAWRRPLKSNESHGLRALYHQLRSEDMPHEEAMRLTLARVLVAPAFLYKAEKPVSGDEAGPVSAHELATRLSYFLWSSAPDTSLRAAADAGALTDDNNLLAHTRRMLSDHRARRLAIEFACQWLHLRGFDELDEKSEKKFPEFANLKGPMYEETIRFFTDMIQNNRSILSVIDADHGFVNGELAAHYGYTLKGDTWKRVDGLRTKGRGGILGQASLLSRQSGASRTSPILRGNWIVETLLGEHLPRPPANVPVLPDDPGGPELNMRELTERHSSDPVCAKCHRRIDPFGFALEQFDAIGKLRTDKRNVETTLPDGASISGLDGLRRYLLTQRKEQFVKQFCRKLLGFALGRSVQLSDEPLLDEMATALKQYKHRFSVAVEKIVLSPQFRQIRGTEQAE